VPELIGIARMAAEGARLEAKVHTEYRELAARSYLARCDNPRLPFRWTINPYRGCEFGCKYCYARYTHEFMELRDPDEFEHKIFAKTFDPARFRREIDRLPVGESVALGTATDPYQPAERRFQVTRRMLEVFAGGAGLRLGITTKSDLVPRDTELLQEISRRHYLTVAQTITTLDADLARLIEPLAPRPDLRLGSVRKLAAAGIRVIVFCAPVLPAINDNRASLEALAGAAAEAGASGFGANILFLKPSAQQVFLPFLEVRFPALARRYRQHFGRSAYLRGAYPDAIRARVREVRQRHWPASSAPPEPELWPHDAQLHLFG